MKKIIVALLLSPLALLTACGGSEPEPQVVQAIPQNKADISSSNVPVVELAPGLSSRTLLEGEGEVAEDGQIAVVHYTGWLYDETAMDNRGQKFDSSVDRGAHFRFPLGKGMVIRGWDEGVIDMKVGEVRELVIPPNLGYGSRGAGSVIPPNSTLVFEVELLEIVK